MTHVIITTETPEEMKAILAFARKSRIRFNAVSIKEEISGSDKKNVGQHENEEFDIDPWLLPGPPASVAEIKKMIEDADSGRGVGIEAARKTIKKRLEKSIGK